MRGTLMTHPKVVAIARHLKTDALFAAWCSPGDPAVPAPSCDLPSLVVDADLAGALGETPLAGHVTVCHAMSRGLRDEVVLRVALGGLLVFWSAARAHGRWDGDDLRLDHSSTSDVDQISGVPGLGHAMKEVGWLTNGDGLTLRNFKEFNVPKTDAERQAEKRAKDQKEAPESQSRTVTKKSRGPRDKRVTREEKIRAESAVSGSTGNSTGVEPPLPPAIPTVVKATKVDLDGQDFKLPDWLPLTLWWQWWGIRPARTRTAGAARYAVEQLQKWRDTGQPPEAILGQSYANGWQGLFELKAGAAKATQQSRIEAGNRAAAAAWLATNPEKAPA